MSGSPHEVGARQQHTGHERDSGRPWAPGWADGHVGDAIQTPSVACHGPRSGMCEAVRALPPEQWTPTYPKLFWTVLLGGFAVAFFITTPANKWMIGRGKGHAVVHAYH